jgi:hypothetical protein
MEVESLRTLVERLESFDCSRYPDPDKLAEALDTLVRTVVQDHEEPEAVYGFVSRKLEKVRRYVENG